MCVVNTAHRWYLTKPHTGKHKRGCMCWILCVWIQSKCITVILPFVSNLLGMWWKLICPMRHVCFLAIVNEIWIYHTENEDQALVREVNGSTESPINPEHWGRRGGTAPVRSIWGQMVMHGAQRHSHDIIIWQWTVLVLCVWLTHTHLSTDSTDAISPNVPTHWCSYSMKLYLTLLVCVV